MTTDDLRAIAARDDEAQRHSGLSQAALDRGALLDLLRRLASVAWHVEGADSDLCLFCRRDHPEHYPNCPAPLLEALR